MREGIARAARWSTTDHRAALARAEAGRVAFADIAAGYDALLCLAATGEAPPGLDSTGDPSQCILWTLLHVPCLTLPAMTGARGLPIGLQVVTGRFEEARLLRVAAALETALGLAGPAPRLARAAS